MATPTKYRKKPVEVDAVELTRTNSRDVAEWCEGTVGTFVDPKEITETIRGVKIATLEGEMIALPGAFVIRGVAGEFYPCQPDIFAATYEEVSR